MACNQYPDVVSPSASLTVSRTHRWPGSGILAVVIHEMDDLSVAEKTPRPSDRDNESREGSTQMEVPFVTFVVTCLHVAHMRAQCAKTTAKGK